MPQDHESWDRKELLRQRKHERPDQSFDSDFRWRDSSSTVPSSSHHVPPELARWGSTEFRRPSCNGKQAGRHQYVEDTSHGYTSSRSNARMFEYDYYRPSTSRGDWRYTRNYRDDRVSLSQKDWKCNTWDMSNNSSRGFERPGNIRNGHRSDDERLPHASDTNTAVVNSWDPVNSTRQPDIELCTPERSHKFKNEFSRWGSGDFRKPSCHGKQGGRHQYMEETSHGYTSPRSSARMFEDDYYRPSASRGDLRYTRNCRDDKVSLSQKDLKGNTWEMSNSSSRGFERPYGIRNGQRSDDERTPHASDTHSTVLNSWHPVNTTLQPEIEQKSKNRHSEERLSLPLNHHSDCVGLVEQPSSERNYGNTTCSPAKQYNDLSGRKLANDNSFDPPILNAELEGTWEQHHQTDLKNNRLNGVSDLVGARKSGKDSSLGVTEKLPVWACSGSFVSPTSGFSHSSNLKSLGAVESSDQKDDILPKIASVTRSSSGVATACATTTQLPEEMSSIKKLRLGWGEGLAKYEKKKVDVNTNEDGVPLLENGTEELSSLNKNIADKSPTAANFPDYGSPTTPSSVACSSSPGFADKSSVKAAITASDVSNMCRSPSPVSSIHIERFPINIEELDNNSIERFGCLLNEWLGTDDPGTWDSNSIQLTSMNRLLAWKGDILKAVEMTESEIDLLENKHRTLKLEGGKHCHVVGPSSYLCEEDENVPKEQEASCNLGHKAANSSVAEILEGNDVHHAVLSKVPVGVFEDIPEEVKSLAQSFTAVEKNEDVLSIPSVKAATSSKEINTAAYSNQETNELFSAPDSIPSSEDLLCAKILSANKKCASESSEVFNELLPRDFSLVDNSRFSGICQMKSNSHVEEKIAERIKFMRAREKTLLLQFKSFQLSWKKDLHQLALTKSQLKSNKKTELYPNAKNNGHLKLPQTGRLRFSSSASRRDNVDPATELESNIEKLLPGTHLKPSRDILRMPAMILDEKERVMSRFISSNGLIEDPCHVEKERAMINPWTSEEKETFLSMLEMHGKDFKKIASYLTHKTTAECIDYYYKNHKSDCFWKIKKQRAYEKEEKHTYMLAPRKKWKREMGAASLDILGAVSFIAANRGNVASTRQISSKKSTLRGCSSSNSLQHDGINSEGSFDNVDFPRKRTVGPLSSEQINHCLRTSMNSREKYTDHLKFDRVAKKPRLSHIIHNDNSNEDDDSCSEESYGAMGPIHWTDDERSAFIQGFSLFGKNFASISGFVRTRSQDQCRVFFSKVRKCLGLEFIQSGSGYISTSASIDNANEAGGSNFEDPCAMKSNSGMCNNGISEHMGLSSPTSPFNMNQEGADHLGSANVKASLGGSEQENGLAHLRLKDVTNLVNNAYINVGFPGLVSEPCRDLVDTNTVESQCQATGKHKRNDLLSLEIDEGNLTSVAVSSDPLYFGSLKASGGQCAALPKHSSKDEDEVMEAANRTRNSSLEAEAAPSDFRYPECLHPVPIEVSTEELLGISVPQGNPNYHTESESPNLKFNLDSNGRFRGLGHVISEQNDQLNAFNTESCQIPRRSFAQDPIRISRSSSDLIVKIQRTGEGFALNKCTSSASKPLFHKDSRNGHSRSHSDMERLEKNGDMKLFGTVFNTDDNENKQKHNPSEIIRPSSTTVSRDHQIINHQHLQNVPITSGFWDGNRIQTGLTSLPESGKLLASYPKATTHLKQHIEDRAEAESGKDEGNIVVDGVAKAS